MQTPVIIFDFVHGVIAQSGIDPDAERRIQEAVAGQRDLVSATGGEPPADDE